MIHLVLSFIFAIFCLNSWADVTSAKRFISDLIIFSKKLKEDPELPKTESDAMLASLKTQTDFSAFSKRALGKFASKATTAEKARFQILMEELVTLSAFPKAKGLSAEASMLQYKNLSKSKVSVTGKIQRDKNGDLVVTNFSMVLFFDAKKRIYDAQLAEDLLSASIHRQLQLNLQKKTFAELLKLMEDRVAKLKSSAKAS